ncbi:MAG: glycosyltransferase family 1 protein [Candidatus Moraniibacteriota bacterium]|nr:MAG: glycosyltransferase family 1 protein [Candidatus Moranbacteria bacterium]
MRIAVQASDLDHTRIDGTRVYLFELLKRFGEINTKDLFTLYHKTVFNSLLTPPSFENYQALPLPFPKAWMQTRFAWEMFRVKPDKLFLPIQAAPALFPRSIEVTATIHDLAFKRYPETFPWRDRLKLNFMLSTVVRQADKLIAVSESTKQDLLEFFPHIPESKIRVIHHGFNKEFFGKRLSGNELHQKLAPYQLQANGYFLYVGALQPRKNLVRLMQAFAQVKTSCPEAKLVLAGEAAWLADEIHAQQRQSQFREDIVLTGRVDFETLRALYQGAKVFTFPSLYEGFGIPILEAFASRVPVITANNSSLPEVAGDGAFYCDAVNTDDIALALKTVWHDHALRDTLIAKGQERLAYFSWDKCAKETMEFILA